MASSLLFNRVKVSTATVGTGIITLGAALTSYLDFISGGVVNLNQVSYLIEDGTNYEIGTGTYTSPVTLTRNVIKSSNSNAAISLSGSAVVSITALSTDIVTPDNAQTLTSKTLTSPVISGGTINNAIIGGTTAAAITGTTITGTNLVGPHNGTVGATTASTGAFTTLSASSNATFTGGHGVNALGTVSAASLLEANSNATGAAVLQGINVTQPIQSGVTTQYASFRSAPTTAAASFTLAALNHFQATSTTLGGASVLTNQQGFVAASTLTQGTNNYGFVGNLPSNATSWNFYAPGTAQNAFAGNTRFGSTTAPVATIDVTGTVAISGGTTIAGAHGTNAFGTVATASLVELNTNATGAVVLQGINVTQPIQSGVTTQYASFRSAPSTAAASFTLATLNHFQATSTTLGGASVLTNQQGFVAASTLTQGTNNYGFVGNLASAATSWNFYAPGTAQNAFAGSTRFGSTTAPTATVDITGTLAVSSTISGSGFTAYFASPPAIGGTTAAAGSFTTVTASTSVLSSGTGGVGYSTGAGVAVTQLTSRTTTTPTTGAKNSGAITLFTTTATVGAYFSFTVPNTAIAATDTVVLTVRGATNTYVASVTAITAATSFQVTMASVAGTASDTPIVNFAIIKAVSA
jgi:hypothetical protein